MPRSPQLDKKVIAFMGKYTTQQAQTEALLVSGPGIVGSMLRRLSTIHPDEVDLCLESTSSDEDKLARFKRMAERGKEAALLYAEWMKA